MVANGGEATRESYERLSETEMELHLKFYQQPELPPRRPKPFVRACWVYELARPTARVLPQLGVLGPHPLGIGLCLDPNLSKDDPTYPARLQLFRRDLYWSYPVTRLETTPMHRAGVWNVDTGAAFKGPITVMDVDKGLLAKCTRVPVLSFGKGKKLINPRMEGVGKQDIETALEWLPTGLHNTCKSMAPPGFQGILVGEQIGTCYLEIVVSIDVEDECKVIFISFPSFR